VRALDAVASGVDAWFQSDRAGLYRVSSNEDIQRLAREGVLTDVPPPRPTSLSASAGFGTAGARRPALRPLIPLPRLLLPGQELIEAAVEAAELRRIVVPATPRPGFPPYILFAPGPTPRTHGASALSGSDLPANACGVIIRLNRDTARRFRGRRDPGGRPEENHAKRPELGDGRHRRELLGNALAVAKSGTNRSVRKSV
jgi:hypothetical protein